MCISFTGLPRFALLASCVLLAAALTRLSAADDLAGYHTVHNAVTATVHPSTAAAAGAAGYLGVQVSQTKGGDLQIESIDDGSRAAKAGLAPGDVLLSADGEKVRDGAAFREWLRAHAPGETIALSIRRGAAASTVTVTLDTASHALKASEERGYVGLTYSEPNDRGATIATVAPQSPAAAAGIKPGDILTKVGGTPVVSLSTLSDVLAEKGPGDLLDLTLLRGEEEKPVSMKLGASQAGPGLAAVLPSIWKRDTYKLAVIPVEFPDTKMNPKITADAWNESLFSTGTYTNKTSATGQKVHGSFADYYHEVSCGKLSVSGRIFAPVQAAKNREAYASISREAEKAAFLNDAIDRLIEREGLGTLKDFDGLIFIYAGERFPKVNRGSLFWPHRATLLRNGRRWPYYVCPEGGPTMASISVYCHEFGHMLGLPDLYARPENPGSEGLGVWCVMSDTRGGGQPQHPSAWCKEQLGWLKPAIIDPGVPQKLILGPVEGSAEECYKVLLRSDGSEYLLLENRRHKGFDTSLPAEGLLIWHIVGKRPILEESHGVEGPLGPRVFLSSVPYPTASNHAYTPFTTPSSRSQLGGGQAVYLTNIRQLEDGRVSFQIGYEYE